MKKKISIVIPSYNEDLNIMSGYESIITIMQKTNYDYELIYVDNNSYDDSYKIFIELVQKDDKVKVVRYSRNFGYQMALKGGIDNSSGDCVICIDGDLQDPPELILEFLKKWEEGYKVVYGIRKSRKGNKVMNLFYKLFYRIISSLSEIKLPTDVGEFGLMDRKVVDIIKELPEVNLYLRGLRAWCGFKQTGVEYIRQDREKGKSKFNLSRSLKLAFDGITSFSNKPLTLIFYSGIIFIFVSFILILYGIIQRIFFSQLVFSGWASLLVTVVFFGGIQLFSIGVLGEYLGRLFEESKKRPKYIISEILENNDNK